MKSYVYEGIKEGKRVKGVLKAKDRRELIKKLKYEGIKPIKIEEKKEKFTLFRKKVSEEELSFMLIQLSVLLSSGIPLTRALELLSSQVENELLIGAINQIKSSIEKGENLAEAFRRTEIFPEFLSEMLTAVQRGENLEYIFQVAGEYLQKVAEFKGKVISSITYPTVVILFSFISLFIAVKVVVPKIANVLEGFGKELPFITKFILVFADVLSVFLILSPLVFIVFYFREKFIKKERLHFILLKLPILGKLNLYFNLSRFSRILAMLLNASVPINSALNLAVKSISNVYLRNKFSNLISDVEKGKSFSALLSKEKEIPELFINLVETGEVSGELEKMLKLLSEIYEKHSERVINFWLRIVEPLAILIIGITVGIIAISVIIPLTEITAGVR